LGKAEAIIQIDLEAEDCLNGALKALKPETLRPVSSRSKVKMRFEGRTLILEFSALDSTALRAAMNSYLRWILTIKELYSIIKGY
jgi:tRNA threonylcarbamoyladenosine modification (KEOPS) complex  Pcc1 subunit